MSLTDWIGNHGALALVVTCFICLPAAIWQHLRGTRPLRKSDLIIIAGMILIVYAYGQGFR